MTHVLHTRITGMVGGLPCQYSIREGESLQVFAYVNTPKNF